MGFFNDIYEKHLKKTNNQNIEIVILNYDDQYKNEEKTIMTGAKNLLENGAVESLEEGIKVFATAFRGLSFKSLEKDNKNNIVITFYGYDNEKQHEKVKGYR